MKKISLIILFVLLMSFLPFQKAFALNCVQSPPPEVAIHEYDVVVIATVTEVHNPKINLVSKTSIKADVSHSFKGYNNNKITFNEDIWGNSKVGTEYLLFLNKSGDGFESHFCSPTSETVGLDMDKLIETLTNEETKNGNEMIVHTPTITETVENNKIKFSWELVLLLSTIIFLVIIVTVIYNQTSKDKHNGK